MFYFMKKSKGPMSIYGIIKHRLHSNDSDYHSFYKSESDALDELKAINYVLSYVKYDNLFFDLEHKLIKINNKVIYNIEQILVH